MRNTMVSYHRVDTPIGVITLIGEDGALVRVLLPNSASELPKEAAESDEFGDLVERLRLYFSGESVDFSDLAIKLTGLGEFETKVLQETLKVPFGKVTTYNALAAAAGSPRAARAVGNAMSKNPLPIVVPCHRVLHADGGLGGYSGGLDIKRKLLTLEGISL
jgi:methylated-DNA-[protein]-cysteine S-methyltransferase